MKSPTGKLISEPKCPTCGTKIDGYSTITDAASPSDGDVSICIYCSEIMVFNGNPLTLIKAEGPLRDEILNDAEVRKTLAVITLIQKKMNQ